MDKFMFNEVYRFAESGDKEAMKVIIGDLLSKGRYSVTAEQSNLALRYLNLLVDEDDSDAILSLGALYYTGFTGIAQDFSKAVYYYEKALETSQNKNPWAMNNLGYCHYYGRTGIVDYERAYSCFAHAAMMGNVNSMYKLGDMYYYGNHVEKKIEAAFYWYSLAKQQKQDADEDYQDFITASIALRLGRSYLFGEGTDIDLIRSLFELRTAEVLFYRQILIGDVFSIEQIPKTQKLIKIAQDELDKQCNHTQAGFE